LLEKIGLEEKREKDRRPTIARAGARAGAQEG
jgi:hypothetical protein